MVNIVVGFVEYQLDIAIYMPKLLFVHVHRADTLSV
jgi:hypothetical protein